MSLGPTAMRRLVREMATLRSSPPDGIRVTTNEEDILDFCGIVQGPEGTPYEGGYFRIGFKFTEEFPAAPPKCTMLTRIFHPNVSKSGEICVNTLKKDWKREYGITHILVTIKCLLIYPNAESALDEAAGKLLLENYDEYFKHAKLITNVHAKPKTRPPEFDPPSITTTPAPATPSLPGPPTTLPGPSRSSIPPIVVESPIKAPQKVSSTVLLPTPEPTEPLQLSPSNNNSRLPPTAPSSSTSITASAASHKDSPHVQNDNPGLPGGPLQPAAGNGNTNAPSLKRAAMVGGVAKRKKGLKRL
ncbi:hypothetical protein BS47DRAFT_1346666 [Hydnum rufescens UP504]|uniref:E2 ubiquitin-conjugating enzyme n=1 Tax=Hydnum rufescens UP504 TaxID=1448309 RepID=A0A9P6DRW1_9AGAM|nr:hypothetical protein BS47DRAFT_1346666 [Hydnum rufescens UP504]